MKVSELKQKIEGVNDDHEVVLRMTDADGEEFSCTIDTIEEEESEGMSFLAIDCTIDGEDEDDEEEEAEEGDGDGEGGEEADEE